MTSIHERTFIEQDWEFDTQTIPRGRNWQMMKATQVTAHLTDAPIFFQASIAHKYVLCNVHTANGVSYYRYMHVFRQHRDALVRQVPFGGRISTSMIVQPECKDSVRIDVHNIGGTKIYSRKWPKTERLDAHMLAWKIKIHLNTSMYQGIPMSFNIDVAVVLAEGGVDELRGNHIIVDPRRPLNRDPYTQAKITKWFLKRR